MICIDALNKQYALEHLFCYTLKGVYFIIRPHAFTSYMYRGVLLTRRADITKQHLVHIIFTCIGALILYSTHWCDMFVNTLVCFEYIRTVKKTFAHPFFPVIWTIRYNLRYL